MRIFEVGEEDACKNCGCCVLQVEDKKDIRGRPMAKAYCDACKKYVKFLKVENEARYVEMPFGKFKGLTLGRIAQQDRDYLEWLGKQSFLKPFLKEKISEVLK